MCLTIDEYSARKKTKKNKTHKVSVHEIDRVSIGGLKEIVHRASLGVIPGERLHNARMTSA